MESGEEPFDEPFGHDLQAAEAGNLEGVEQVEPGGTVGGGHAGGNVPGSDARSQRGAPVYPGGDIGGLPRPVGW